MNVTDSDGDTPLYVVENIETARWLVEHGATVQMQNGEGVSVSSVAHLSQYWRDGSRTHSQHNVWKKSSPRLPHTFTA